MQTGEHSLLYFMGAMLLAVACNATAQDGPAQPKPLGLMANQFEVPISFEPNRGQAEEKVKFMARGPGYTLAVTDQGLVLSFEQPESRAGSEGFHSIGLKFAGANVVPKLAATDELTTKSSYFLGADPTKWRTGIPNYARVTIENVYAGTDVMYRGTNGRLQCSFLIASGAKPGQITMAISGASDPRIDSEGNLILHSRKTELRLSKPTAYQDIGAKRYLVGARYVLRRGRITFALTSYDESKTLTIDSVMNYEGYLTTEDAVSSPLYFQNHD